MDSILKFAISPSTIAWFFVYTLIFFSIGLTVDWLLRPKEIDLEFLKNKVKKAREQREALVTKLWENINWSKKNLN
ncbi:unnamed protein product [Blepharisma stoltei]|uniref:ATP synthase F0 subunit 8 n=1 Tax=Blepharisma stoltei TaxID=1481888 RepID=A0AAU9JSZ6_9CILI|nr:unnamed protein product [Blepharisma stoltei]